MASSLSFQCISRMDAAVNLCMNDGICQIDNSTVVQTCSCPPGWMGDFVAYHQPNVSDANKNKGSTLNTSKRRTNLPVNKCSMPSNALLGVLICVAVETALCLAALYFRRSRAKGEARTVLNFANLIVILIFFQVLSNYLEGGYFVSTPILLFLVITMACLWASRVSEILALPIFSMNLKLQRKVFISIRACFTMIVLVNAGCCIALAATGRSDDDRFNRINFIYNILLFIAELTTAAIILIFGYQLEQSIHETSLTDVAENFQTKIRSLQTGAVSFAFFQIPAMVGTVAYVVLGSAPYFWIVQFALFTFTSPSVTLATLGLLARGERKNSPQQNNNTLSSMTSFQQ